MLPDSVYLNSTGAQSRSGALPVIAAVCVRDGSNADARWNAWFPLVRIHLTHAVGGYHIVFSFYRCVVNWGFDKLQTSVNRDTRVPSYNSVVALCFLQEPTCPQLREFQKVRWIRRI